MEQRAIGVWLKGGQFIDFSENQSCGLGRGWNVQAGLVC